MAGEPGRCRLAEAEAGEARALCARCGVRVGAHAGGGAPLRGRGLRLEAAGIMHEAWGARASTCGREDGRRGSDWH